MKYAIIVTGGNAPLYIPDTLNLDDSFIIAADSGVDVAAILGLKCDIAVGDFDSIENNELLKKINCKVYPKDKDFSDTELAIALAKEKGFKNYILIGGGEGRMDHLFGIWTLFEKYGTPICWITRKESLYLVKEKRKFITAKGETVSILPANLNSKAIVNAQELKWPLNDYKIDHSNISLSNETTRGILNINTKNAEIFVSFLTAREKYF